MKALGLNRSKKALLTLNVLADNGSQRRSVCFQSSWWASTESRDFESKQIGINRAVDSLMRACCL